MGNIFKNRILIAIACVALWAMGAYALQDAPAYPLLYGVMGTIQKGNAPTVEGFTVILYKVSSDPSKGYATGVTDAYGKFDINPFDDDQLNAKPGDTFYLGVIAKGGYGVAESTIQLNLDGYTEINTLTLAANKGVGDPEGGTFTITVLDSKSSPINTATVVVEGTGLSTSTGASGIYSLKNVPIGTYTLSASASDYQKNSISASIAVAGETVEKTITLQSAVTGVPTSPTVTSIEPNNGEPGQTVNITNLIGANFIDGTTVKLTRSGQTDIAASIVNYLDASHLSCSFTLPANAATGAWDVTVNTSPTLGGTLEGGFTINAKGTSPTIGSILPKEAKVGDTVETVLTGTNFTADSTVNLSLPGEANISTTAFSFDSNTNKITCSFNLTGVKDGAWTVIVANKDGKSGSLNQGFTINPATPVKSLIIDTLSPLTGAYVITSYSVNFSASGGKGAYQWSLPDGSVLPDGLTLATDGKLSGAPAAATADKTFTFKIQVKDEAPTTFQKDFSLTVSKQTVPTNTVQLTISKATNDLQLAWETDSAPDIYSLSGQYDPSQGWTKIFDGATGQANAGFSADLSNKTLKHSNEFGGGAGEAYYKALEAGKDPATLLSQAWAVGKLNLTLSASPNLISTPFETAGKTFDQVFNGQINQDKMLLAGYDNVSKSYNIYQYSGTYPAGTWGLTTGKPFSIVIGAPYWLVDSKTGVITLLGPLPTISFSADFPKGPNLFSLAGPKSYSSIDSAGLSPINGDLVARYNNVSKSYEMQKSVSSAWENTDSSKKIFGLNPGWGYWYINSNVGKITFSPK